MFGNPCNKCASYCRHRLVSEKRVLRQTKLSPRLNFFFMLTLLDGNVVSMSVLRELYIIVYE